MNEGRTRRPIYHFGNFILDLERGTLLASSGSEVSLRPKAFSLLRLFVENAGRLVDRGMIIEALWAGTVVTDESVAQCIKDVRRALGDEAQHLVKTVRGRGYRLEATVVCEEHEELQRRLGDHAADLRVGRARDEDASSERGRGDDTNRPRDGRAEAERRLITVMSCGLVEAAALTFQLDPEDLRQVMVACHCSVASAVAQHGGKIAEYHGDSVLARFGWPIATEDDPERAIRAALSVVKVLENLALPLAPGPLHARVGIATGPMIAGDGETPAQSMLGMAPTLAAQLQAAADPGTVLISEMTWQLVGALFECEEINGTAGRTPPIRAWRVVSESGVNNRFAALRATSLATLPLIGRDEEQEIFQRRWERACGGDGQVVVLSGEPGIGKSRLNAAFQAAVARIGRTHERQDWFCLPHLQHSELHPVIAELERGAGFRQDDTSAEKFDKLGTLLGGTGWSSDDVRLVAGLLGVAPGNQDSAPVVNPRRQRERLLEALVRRVETLAQARPLLAVLEDVHWADPTTCELVDLLIVRIASLPALLVLTHRPSFQAPWVGEAHVTELRLSRLNKRQCATLIRHIVGDSSLPPETVAAIIERADGVPLFLEELTKAVLERAAHGAALSPRADIGVPATLQSSLVARLDRFGPIAREVAQAGAAIGRVFSYDLLRSIVDVPEPALSEALTQLASSGLIQVRGTSIEAKYTFKHALVHDVANDLLLRERRRVLHARIVESLRGHDDEPPEVLALHCTMAGFADQAIAQWRLAGDRSAARFANLEAKEHYQQALELLQSLPPSRERDRNEAELCLAQVVPLTAVHGFGSQAVETFALRARELSGSLNPLGRFLAHRIVWNSSLMRHPLPRTVGLARDLVSLADRDGDMRQQAAAHRALGYSLYIIGALEEADRVLERGIALADTVADADFLAFGENPQIVSRVYRGLVLSLLGYPETALQVAEEGLARARLRNDPHAIAWSLNAIGRISHIQRNVRLAARAGAEALEISREHSLPQWLALAELGSGWAACAAGETEKGLALLLEGHRRWKVTEAKLHATQNHVQLAEGYLFAGMAELALDHLSVARSHGESFGELCTASEVCHLMAMALQAGYGPALEIEARLKEALEVSRGQKARLLELRAATGLARLWRDQGRRAEAIHLLAPLYEWFTEGFALPDLIEAGALLPDLGIRSASDPSFQPT